MRCAICPLAQHDTYSPISLLLQYSTKLLRGVDLKGAGCIVLYCEAFNADLGHVAIKKISG